MKIDSSYKPTVPPATGGVKARASENTSRSGADEVRLSSVASQLQAGDNEPPVDSARVAEIRQAIAEGRFAIDASAIADSLIASARELVSQRKA